MTNNGRDGLMEAIATKAKSSTINIDERQSLPKIENAVATNKITMNKQIINSTHIYSEITNFTIRFLEKTCIVAASAATNNY